MMIRTSFRSLSIFALSMPACVSYAELGTNDHFDVGAATGAGVGGGASASSTSASSASTGGMGAGVGGGGVCQPGATQACYTGPAGTQGIGACKPGTQTCAADGMSYGACSGDVQPSAENCASPADENCDGKSPDCSGVHLWSKRFGDAGEQTGVRVATDTSGNVFLVGHFTSTIDLGAGSLKSLGGYDVFVAKFDPTGKALWSKSFGGPGDQLAGSLAVDLAGNVVITGNFDTSIDLGSGAPLVSAGGTDVYLAKLDGATGSTTWAKRYGDAGNASPRGLVIDSAGNVLVTGYYTSSIDFGGGALPSAGGDDIFVAKISGTGTPVWSKRFGDKDAQEAYGIAIDSSDNVAITGNLAGSATFGPTTLTSAGGYDVFIAKFDSSGAPIWAKRFGDAGSQTASAIGIDVKGSILLTGTMSTIDFGGGSIAGSMFAAKLNPLGSHLWSKAYSQGLPQDLAVDGAGNVVIAAAFNGTINPGVGAPLTSAGGTDALVLKLDGSNGTSVWAKRAGDGADQDAYGVATDIGGSVFVTGAVVGAIDFGGNSLVSAGGRDAFLVKLAP